MPEVFFTIRLPDGKTRQCYSPSTVVHDYFKTGESMRLLTFVERSREALAAASERVRVRHGFACTSAAAQLAEIERLLAEHPADGEVRVLGI